MTDDGYELFCNRDEKRTRQPALPPCVTERNGVKFIAPRDAEAGGSWIAVNERGLSLCLLNWYDVPVPASDDGRYTTRGDLVLSLMDQIQPLPTGLECYRPFLLLVLAPRQEPWLWTWDGAHRQQEVATMPVTTSSFDTANVCRARRESFTGAGERYHLTGHGASSVCMSRPDAQTVSFSHVIVRPGQIEFRYRPRQPDGSFAPATVVNLP